MSLNLKSELHGDPIFTLHDFNARLSQAIAEGDEASVEYMLQHFTIDDDGAKPIHCGEFSTKETL